MGLRREQGIRAEQEHEHTRIAFDPCPNFFLKCQLSFLVRQLPRGRFASVQFGKAIKSFENICPFLRADLGAAALVPLPILRANAK